MRPPRVDNILIVGPSRSAIEAALRELLIPPASFLRLGSEVQLLTTSSDLRDVRGIECAWAPIPDHIVDPVTASMLMSRTRHQPMTFHELIARRLAWRTWHEQ
jgi:hypothetical protein